MNGTDQTATPTTAAEWETAAQRYEAAARDARAESSASFDRCDTDGFLSQWASDSMARLYDAKAAWARDHGTGTLPALFDTEGQIISTQQVSGRYGTSWRLDDDAATRFGRRFVTDSSARTDARRIANNTAKGVSLGMIRVRGEFRLMGASAISVRPGFEPDEDALRAGKFEVVSTCLRFDG